jgi:hypothetical protein
VAGHGFDDGGEGHGVAFGGMQVFALAFSFVNSTKDVCELQFCIMLRRLTTLVVFGVLLTAWPHAAKGFASGSRGTDTKSPVPPTHVIIDQAPTPTDANAEDTETKKNGYEKSLGKFEWVIGCITVVFVAISGSTLFAIWRLAKIMEQQAEDGRGALAEMMLTTQSTLNAIERQVDLVEDTRKRQLRAYLCISQARLNFSKDGQIKAQIHVKNTGQTPAYKVRVWGQQIIQEHPLSAPLDQQGSELLQSDGIMPPGGEHILITKPVQSTEAELVSVYTPNYAVYTHGGCSYQDIFGVVRTLEYRLIFGGPATTATKQDSNGDVYAMLSMDIEGNEERDDEPHQGESLELSLDSSAW